LARFLRHSIVKQRSTHRPILNILHVRFL